MLISLAMIAAQAAGMVSNSRPPEVAVIAVQPSAPNVISTGPIVTTSRIARPMAPLPAEIVPLRVRVTAGDRVLFNDVMRVSRSVGANHNESRSEGGRTICTEPNYYGNSQRYSFTVNLSWQDHMPRGPAVRLDVSWQRPMESSDPCIGDGSRTIGLAQTVPLAQGESYTLRGDGGLVVTVSRP